jgi:hypothetical protein
MNRRLILSLAVAATALLAGCASGPKFTEVAQSLPKLKEGEGRIYFFRSSSMLGAAIQPDIRLNGNVVGESKPGSFFFIDRPAGSYTASTQTETEKTGSFTLDAGETKYVRTSPSIGLLVGRIVVSIEDPVKAKNEIDSLAYIGAPLAK